ncbi:hypothetical protein ACLM5J_19630 [Nocardioides sp. Bht2]|uniref:hypothetical protein n=1 Tax=Nocardioides sp. Bht2 TaxID=3392297 RepID=UPI0039B5C6B9
MSALTRQLDQLLFTTDGWFAIDATNRRVPRLVVPTLETGLDLVDAGDVASIVGRVQPGITVIDVDAEGWRGHQATHALTTWCRDQDLWHLARASGGAEGRHHVFITIHAKQAALRDFVDELTTRLNLPAGALDLRTSGHIRPLSAPHRTGATTRPSGDLTTALRQLRARRGPDTRSTPVAPRSRAEALLPRPRRHRQLPAEWTQYFETGTLPAIGGTDHSRSTYEAIATKQLLWAGHTVDTAWATICDAHPSAMQRARSSRTRWIRWVWNPAVENDNAHTPDQNLSPTTAAAVASARHRLLQLAWSLPERRRPALLLVGHHVLDRMERADSRRVPVPERDLVLDTGLTDRKTIRAILRLLHGAVGALDTSTWDHQRRDSTSFEFEVPASTGLLEIPPPSSHTPTPPGSWHRLGPLAHALWRALSPEHPASVDDLAHAAALLPSPDSEVSPQRLRTLTHALTELARAGLAHCTTAGAWVRRIAPAAEHTHRAQQRHAEVTHAITLERAAYRATRCSPWRREQIRVLQAQHRRHLSWWNSLSAPERLERQNAWTARFANLPVDAQEHLKSELVDRRSRASIDERTRHRDWATSLSPADYLERSITRQRQFATLPSHLQSLRVASWARHRARHQLPTADTYFRTGAEHDELLPRGRDDRDRGYLEHEQAGGRDLFQQPARGASS